MNRNFKETVLQSTFVIDNLLNAARTPEDPTRNGFDLSHMDLVVGQWVDVKNKEDKWCEAQIHNIRDYKPKPGSLLEESSQDDEEGSKPKEGQKEILVRYAGIQDQTEWLKEDST